MDDRGSKPVSSPSCVEPRLGDLMSAYEMGLLEKQDQSRFEAHLDQCAGCLEDLYSGAMASEELRAHPGRYRRVLEAATSAPGSSFLDRLSDYIKRLLQLRVLVPVGAVAAVALVLMVIQPGLLPSAGDLAFIEPLPYQELELRGGVGQDLDRLLAEGMQQYASGNYQAASASLGSVWNQTQTVADWPDRHQTALFLGLCLLLDDRPDEAMDPLTLATNSNLLPIAERGKWYLAQTHLLREDTKSSITLLESLLNSPVYGTLAAAQLQSVLDFCDNSHGS